MVCHLLKTNKKVLIPALHCGPIGCTALNFRTNQLGGIIDVEMKIQAACPPARQGLPSLPAAYGQETAVPLPPIGSPAADPPTEQQ